MRNDLETVLSVTKQKLNSMGMSRSNSEECREYLTELADEVHDLCKAAVKGHYEGPYFALDDAQSLSAGLFDSCRRLRAVLQQVNKEFAEEMRGNGHTYRFLSANDTVKGECPDPGKPESMTRADAWLGYGYMLVKLIELLIA